MRFHRRPWVRHSVTGLLVVLIVAAATGVAVIGVTVIDQGGELEQVKQDRAVLAEQIRLINARAEAAGQPAPAPDPAELTGKTISPPGATGSTGEKGERGIAGQRGEIGPEGKIGPAGPGGLEGKPGDVAPPGPPGAAGIQGAPGPAGQPGATGPTGPPGNDGAPGATGATGPGPTDEQVDDAVARYCAARNNCTGPQGPPGPGPLPL